MFSITPEALNAINMIPPHRHTATLTNHHVIASQGQRGVGLPVIREVKAARLGIDLYQSQHFLTIAARDWKNPHLTIPLQNTEHDHLAAGSPATLAFPTAANHGFVQFQVAVKGFHALLIQGHNHPTAAVESIQSRTAGHTMKAEPIYRNTQAKIIQDLALGSLADAETLPDGSDRVPVTTPAALATAIR